MTQEIPHILIADDNPEIREIIKVLLTGEGFSVTEAKDGTSVLTEIKKQAFDLIILDIMMPGMNGYETCQSIREASNVPILFLSARTTDSDKILGFSSGGDDFLELICTLCVCALKDWASLHHNMVDEIWEESSIGETVGQRDMPSCMCTVPLRS